MGIFSAIAGPALGALGSIIGAKKSKPKQPVPWSTTGPAGSTQVNKRTRQISFAQDTSNPFYQLFNQLGPEFFANALGMSGEMFGGADPEVAAAYEGLFGQGLTDRIGENYNLLNQMAEPDEMSAFRSLADNLYSRTGLSTTGDADKMAAFERTRSQADLGRQLQAIGLGRDEAGTRFEAAMKAAGLGQAEQFQQFGFGQEAFGGLQQLFQNLIQQAGIGTQTPVGAAQPRGLGWQAGMNFLNNSGLFSGLSNLGRGSQITPPTFQFAVDPRTLPINVGG